MATVKTVQKYNFDNKEFNSLKDLKSYVESMLGKHVIDKIMVVCPPERISNVLKVLDLLSQKDIRETLTKYLNVTYEHESTEYVSGYENRNILDLKI